MCLSHHQLVLRCNDTTQGLTNSIKTKVIDSSHRSVIVRECHSPTLSFLVAHVHAHLYNQFLKLFMHNLINISTSNWKELRKIMKKYKRGLEKITTSCIPLILQLNYKQPNVFFHGSLAEIGTKRSQVCNVFFIDYILWCGLLKWQVKRKGRVTNTSKKEREKQDCDSTLCTSLQFQQYTRKYMDTSHNKLTRISHFIEKTGSNQTLSSNLLVVLALKTISHDV